MGIKQTVNRKKEPARVPLNTQELDFTLPVLQPLDAGNWRTMKAEIKKNIQEQINVTKTKTNNKK